MARFTNAGGFTLSELLIVIAILGMVAAALLGVFQVSQQTYTRAASLEHAQLGARAGLDRTATELRLIGAYWTGAGAATDAITAASATGITFIGDVNADTLDSAKNEITLQTAASSGATQITVDRTTGGEGNNAFAAGEYVYIADGAVREVRQIASSYTAGATLPLATAVTNSYPAGSIVRSVETLTYTFNSSASTLTRTAGSGTADTIVENVTGFTLTYYDANGASLGSSPALSSIQEIQIDITTRGNDGSRRSLTSRVKPRNLSLQ